MNSSQPHPYLWVAHPLAAQFSFPDRVADRFLVRATHIWQDTRPEEPPPFAEPIPSFLFPYLRLFSHQLHLPNLYGTIELEGSLVPLLKNAPIDRQGNLYPTLQEVWSEASPTRQMYWLWQILNLWTPLKESGVASTLLVPENVRVEGWRVRVLEFHRDLPATDRAEEEPSSIARQLSAAAVAVVSDASPATLLQLAQSWEPLLPDANVAIASFLEEIIIFLKTEGLALTTIANALNADLLNQASQYPLRVTVTGATEQGRIPTHNEDSCYPIAADLIANGTQWQDRLSSHFAIVCDGIGGHEGGEVASQMAVQSLKLQARALLAEIAEDPEVMTPDLVKEQLAATIRIANNAIASRNDQQGRESQRRMATTLVMTLQLPQQIATSNGGTRNSHELYLAHVGDSRAYWITTHYCQQLTVDDDVVTREVCRARSLEHKAQQRPDARALTQALGTRNAELLRPTVQRLIIEEDGVLLLCSDGLSDGDVVEESWSAVIPDAIRGKISLEAALKELIRRANEKNGQDNISGVATLYGIMPQNPVLVNLAELPKGSAQKAIEIEKPLETAEEELPVEEEVAPVEASAMPARAVEETETGILEEEDSGEGIGWVIKLLLLTALVGVMVLLLRWQIQTDQESETPASSPTPEQVEPETPSSSPFSEPGDSE
ncbi:protein phosphatase 2C domain-containing protein [Lusitaniella coriacea LEGE 07157]|uniref:Protein phosphatase 2C domain-containing protein n=1 Tax=Lusitaniella coriacea LEGE 07157 TaxID=945747 RepID=A0A8J7AXP4_9CYAN|nr:protein phosphatase 2C domain-containing protein [Lusitaniella coriacea]MBE9114629.1 protein phosphatase 2C domain-containing protein [Lusitaniella coriacea LEGE 07157]